jgi:hypothetical protein
VCQGNGMVDKLEFNQSIHTEKSASKLQVSCTLRLRPHEWKCQLGSEVDFVYRVGLADTHQ